MRRVAVRIVVTIIAVAALLVSTEMAGAAKAIGSPVPANVAGQPPNW